MEKITARCMKCKENRELVDVEETTMKNGRRAAKGKCSKCGTNCFKILGNAKTA